MINYQKLLDKNMQNVFKDILTHIKNHGLSDNNQLYITFLTKNEKVEIPEWIKEKYPEEMTIVVQYEYYDLKVNKTNFSITLSFNNIKTNIIIDYDSVISIADPSANFGLIFQKKKIKKKSKKILDTRSKKNNVINFSNYKKKLI